VLAGAIDGAGARVDKNGAVVGSAASCLWTPPVAVVGRAGAKTDDDLGPVVDLVADTELELPSTSSMSRTPAVGTEVGLDAVALTTAALKSIAATGLELELALKEVYSPLLMVDNAVGVTVVIWVMVVDEVMVVFKRVELFADAEEIGLARLLEESISIAFIDLVGLALAIVDKPVDEGRYAVLIGSESVVVVAPALAAPNVSETEIVEEVATIEVALGAPNAGDFAALLETEASTEEVGTASAALKPAVEDGTDERAVELVPKQLVAAATACATGTSGRNTIVTFCGADSVALSRAASTDGGRLEVSAYKLSPFFPPSLSLPVAWYALIDCVMGLPADVMFMDGSLLAPLLVEFLPSSDTCEVPFVDEEAGMVPLPASLVVAALASCVEAVPESWAPT
jgi:hypothetical protein